MAFDAAERNGRFGRIQWQRGKESNSRRKRKRRVFLCGWTVRVKVIDKVIPESFLKVEERGTLVGAIDRREGRIEELVGGQNPGHELPHRSRKRQEKRGQGRSQERSDCQRSDGEGWVCQGHWGEEIRGDDPVEYFLPTGVGSTSWVPKRVMAIEVPQNEEISGGGKNEGRKGLGVESIWTWARLQFLQVAITWHCCMLSRVSFTNRTVIFTNQVISFTIYNPTHNNTNNAYSITSIPRVTRVISTVRDPSASGGNQNFKNRFSFVSNSLTTGSLIVESRFAAVV